MVAQVRAVTPAVFKAYLARKKAEIAAANKLAEDRRKQLAEQQSQGDAAQTSTPPQSAPTQKTGSTGDTQGTP
jgi:hypothetical protein